MITLSLNIWYNNIPIIIYICDILAVIFYIIINIYTLTN